MPPPASQGYGQATRTRCRPIRVRWELIARVRGLLERATANRSQRDGDARLKQCTPASAQRHSRQRSPPVEVGRRLPAA